MSNQDEPTPDSGASAPTRRREENRPAYLLSTEDLERVVRQLQGKEPRFEGESPIRMPLSVADFERVLNQIDEMGWKWTEHLQPQLKPKVGVTDAAKDLRELSLRYPDFPVELGAVLRHLILGHEASEDVVGPTDWLRAKSDLAQQMIANEEFRCRFFFVNNTRGTRFQASDWEVQVKFAEQHVQKAPSIAVTNLTLETLERQPDGEDFARSITFWADEPSLRQLISSLNEALAALGAIKAQLSGKSSTNL